MLEISLYRFLEKHGMRFELWAVSKHCRSHLGGDRNETIKSINAEWQSKSERKYIHCDKKGLWVDTDLNNYTDGAIAYTVV